VTEIENVLNKFDVSVERTMAEVQFIVYCVVGFFALIVVVYVLARVASLGYYRSRDDYDRSVLEKYFRRKKD